MYLPRHFLFIQNTLPTQQLSRLAGQGRGLVVYDMSVRYITLLLQSQNIYNYKHGVPYIAN